MNTRSDTRGRGACGPVGPVAVRRQRIARRVADLARQLAAHYRGRELTVVAVLDGSLIFLADLVRRLPSDMRVSIQTVRARSYRGRSRQAGRTAFRGLIDRPLAGRHVLVVEDILDTGQTLRDLLADLRAHRPASLRTCVLLRKHRPGAEDRPAAEFVGFEVGEAFVVGYGLDLDGRYRNLPDLHLLNAPGRPSTNAGQAELPEGRPPARRVRRARP